MRQSEEFFGATSLELLHIAKRLKEAQRVEGVLNEAGIDYLVEVDTYFGGIIFQSARAGAFFYVPAGNRPLAAGALKAAGIKVSESDLSDSPRAQ